MEGQKFWILCEEIETPQGQALVKLAKGLIGNEPIVDYEKAKRLAIEYSTSEDVPVFVIKGTIDMVVGQDIDEDYEAPEFTDISESHYSR